MHSLNINKIKEWSVILPVENKKVKFKCDTGAQCNVLSLGDLKKIVDDENPYWSETKIKLEVFGGRQLNPLGKTVLNVYNKNKIFKTEFVILKENVKPILGLSSLIEMQMLNNIESSCSNEEINVSSNKNMSVCTTTNNINNIKSIISPDDKNKNMLISNNIDLFQGVGQFEEALELHIQTGTVPVVKPPRRVPQALRSRLEDKLRTLEDHQIIKKVAHPKNFVSNLVIIEKKDKSLRICLDPKDLNKVLVREHYLIPTYEEIITKLTNKSVFSVLDLSDGFYNIKLTDSSSDLCTFSTPFGTYKFLRLPFGVSVAPEVFQRYSEKAFGDISGVIVYCDDLLIASKSEAEHDAILAQVFERARKCNVKFNKNKFQYKLKEVKYFGHVFSEEGIKIDPDRIKSIVSIKSPENKKMLQIFLGMVNYLRKFVPNLANIISPLRELLKKEVEWLWTEIHEKSFIDIKNVITKAPILQSFNSKLPIVIQCDASKDGLGGCLLQNGKPISFISRSLTSAEQNFSQIEKELLSVVWSTKKFHYYIYGQKCTILNDHKPLESLLKKSIHDIPSPRLQRLKLKLLKYDLEFKYLKGKQMFIADLLSRSYLPSTDIDESYINEVIHCIGLSQNLQCSEEQKQQLISETSKDEELLKIIEYNSNGWPEKIKNIPDYLHYYYKFKTDISVDEGIVFLNHRIIVPKNLRLEYIKKLHEGHIGMTKMKQLARELYYWPKIDCHLENFVRECFICQTYQNNNIKEPLLPHSIPKLPFSKLGVDILEFRRKNYFILYDYYSKWLDIKLLSSKSAGSIINSLIDSFSNFGVPSEIISDHVPFDSRECKLFALEWGFKFTYSSPHYPQSNGMAERAVQIAKKILFKCYDDNIDYRVALLQYRSSPVSGTHFSPAQLLMNRNLKTKLPVTMQYLKPKINTNIELEMSKTQNRNIKNYNLRSRNRSEFLIGQNVWFKKDVNGKKWQQGKIVSKNKFRSYNVSDTNGVIYCRTSYHIRA